MWFWDGFSQNLDWSWHVIKKETPLGENELCSFCQAYTSIIRGFRTKSTSLPKIYSALHYGLIAGGVNWSLKTTGPGNLQLHYIHFRQSSARGFIFILFSGRNPDCAATPCMHACNMWMCSVPNTWHIYSCKLGHDHSCCNRSTVVFPVKAYVNYICKLYFVMAEGTILYWRGIVCSGR
jgi:hypothetical protein